ncbi:MAG: rhodanese-like domain-containing protein [Rickettsiales bacterium]
MGSSCITNRFDSPLSDILQKAVISASCEYAGDISPLDVYNYAKHHKSIIIDVRTKPEWQFVGIPDLSGTKSRLLTVSWKNYPDFSLNTNFVEELLSSDDIAKDMALFFICRSGGRSMDAAIALSKEGFNYCFNIDGGFEGDPDENRHRSTKDGWKYYSLPWIQG